MLQKVEGACYDLDYAHETVVGLASLSQFANVGELLKSAIQVKKQLDEHKKVETLCAQTVGGSSTTVSKIVSYTGKTTQESLTITPKSFD